MKKKYSFFKQPEQDIPSFHAWVRKLETANGYEYHKLSIQTSLGRTQVYGLGTDRSELETLVIFPGFRTTSLIWDLDNGLKSLSKYIRIFLVETNGQPNLSDGNSPSKKLWTMEDGEQKSLKN